MRDHEGDAMPHYVAPMTQLFRFARLSRTISLSPSLSLSLAISSHSQTIFSLIFFSCN